MIKQIKCQNSKLYILLLLLIQIDEKQTLTNEFEKTISSLHDDINKKNKTITDLDNQILERAKQIETLNSKIQALNREINETKVYNYYFLFIRIIIKKKFLI